MAEACPILELNNLSISFFSAGREGKAVQNLSYTLARGEIMGIVGESGSGKSVQAYSILGLLPETAHIIGGEILLNGASVLQCDKKQLRLLRGRQVSMIFQNPGTCLNPVYSIGAQLLESLHAKRGRLPRKQARARCIELLELVGINHAEQRMKQYPHELSGGMQQRVMIAMGLIGEPELLIADEPTTALDVTMQAQILELMRQIQQKNGMSILFITHNLGVVAELCDSVCVLYGGRVMERGRVGSIFDRPLHPYTRGLLRSVPRLDRKRTERLVPIPGTPADAHALPLGCPFAPRCTEAQPCCRVECPPLREPEPMHWVACWQTQEERVGGVE